MASHGIKDRVAIVGMGCTRFAEHWDKGLDDLIIEASEDAFASAGVTKDDVDAYWLGTAQSGMSGITLARPLQLVGQAGDPGRELLHHRLRGPAGCRLRRGLRRLRHGHGGRGGEGQGLGVPGTQRLSHPQRRDGPDPDRGGHVLDGGSGLREEVRGQRGPADRGAGPDLVEEPPQRGAQPPGPVPQGGVHRDHLCVTPGGRAARGVRLRRRGGRGGQLPSWSGPRTPTGSPTSRSTSKPCPSPPGRGSGLIDPDYDYTWFPECAQAAEDAYRQAGITDPRGQLAMAEVHDCFTPTELVLMEDLGFADRGTAWKEVLAGTFDRTGELPVNPDGGLKSFGHPVGASGLRMFFEAWLQLRGEATPERQIATDRTLALTHNLGGYPGEMVSFVSVVGTELG